MISWIKDALEGTPRAVFLALLVLAFMAGGIWWQLTTAMRVQDEILIEIKELRRDVNRLELGQSEMETTLRERIARADLEHQSFERRFDRLERLRFEGGQ